MIEEGVCFLVLCEHNHDKASAFAYLDDLYREFRVCDILLQQDISLVDLHVFDDDTNTILAVSAYPRGVDCRAAVCLHQLR